MKVKALLIDVKAQEVREVEVHDYKDIDKHIGCDCFTMGGENRENHDILYVDDEGLLKNPERFFLLPSFNMNPLAGNGLIEGTGIRGNEQNVKTSIEDIRKDVHFLNQLGAYCLTVANEIPRGDLVELLEKGEEAFNEKDT